MKIFSVLTVEPIENKLKLLIALLNIDLSNSKA